MNVRIVFCLFAAVSLGGCFQGLDGSLIQPLPDIGVRDTQEVDSHVPDVTPAADTTDDAVSADIGNDEGVVVDGTNVDGSIDEVGTADAAANGG